MYQYTLTPTEAINLQNYKSYVGETTITVNKGTLVSDVTLKSDIYEGDLLSYVAANKLTNTTVKNANNEVVAGTWAFENPTNRISLASTTYAASLVFTPTQDDSYNSLTVSITFNATNTIALSTLTVTEVPTLMFYYVDNEETLIFNRGGKIVASFADYSTKLFLMDDLVLQHIDNGSSHSYRWIYGSKTIEGTVSSGTFVYTSSEFASAASIPDNIVYVNANITMDTTVILGNSTKVFIPIGSTLDLADYALVCSQSTSVNTIYNYGYLTGTNTSETNTTNTNNVNVSLGGSLLHNYVLYNYGIVNFAQVNYYAETSSSTYNFYRINTIYNYSSVTITNLYGKQTILENRVAESSINITNNYSASTNIVDNVFGSTITITNGYYLNNLSPVMNCSKCINGGDITITNGLLRMNSDGSASQLNLMKGSSLSVKNLVLNSASTAHVIQTGASLNVSGTIYVNSGTTADIYVSTPEELAFALSIWDGISDVKYEGTSTVKGNTQINIIVVDNINLTGVTTIADADSSASGTKLITRGMLTVNEGKTLNLGGKKLGLVYYTDTIYQRASVENNGTITNGTIIYNFMGLGSSLTDTNYFSGTGSKTSITYVNGNSNEVTATTLEELKDYLALDGLTITVEGTVTLSSYNETLTILPNTKVVMNPGSQLAISNISASIVLQGNTESHAVIELKPAAGALAAALISVSSTKGIICNYNPSIGVDYNQADYLILGTGCTNSVTVTRVSLVDVTTAAELNAALAYSGFTMASPLTINVAASFNLTSDVIIPVGKILTGTYYRIYLNGYSLTAEYNSSTEYGIIRNGYATSSITKGTIAITQPVVDGSSTMFPFKSLPNQGSSFTTQYIDYKITLLVDSEATLDLAIAFANSYSYYNKSYNNGVYVIIKLTNDVTLTSAKQIGGDNYNVLTTIDLNGYTLTTSSTSIISFNKIQSESILDSLIALANDIDNVMITIDTSSGGEISLTNDKVITGDNVLIYWVSTGSYGRSLTFDNCCMTFTGVGSKLVNKGTTTSYRLSIKVSTLAQFKEAVTFINAIDNDSTATSYVAIILIADITLDEDVVITNMYGYITKGSYTLNLNGHNISYTTSAKSITTYTIYIKEYNSSGTVTVYINNGGLLTAGVTVSPKTSWVLKDGETLNTSTYNLTMTGSTQSIVGGEGSTLIIGSGTINISAANNNFYDAEGTLLTSVGAGTYVWDSTLNSNVGGWKLQ